MKRLFLLSILLLGTLIFLSCRKNVSGPKYTISGRLLESSSNPIPITNFKLRVNQRTQFGIFGGIAGIDLQFATDANGYFSLSYSPGKGTGLFTGALNIYPLWLTGIDTIKFKGLYPEWYPVSPNKDTVFNNIYLYKKIEKFVRKIQFDSALPNNDSLEVTTPMVYRSIFKRTVYGPIPAGTLLVLDTINQFSVERYSITSGSYQASSLLRKPPYVEGFNLPLPPGDEAYREQLLVYP